MQHCNSTIPQSYWLQRASTFSGGRGCLPVNTQRKAHWGPPRRLPTTKGNGAVIWLQLPGLTVLSRPFIFFRFWFLPTLEENWPWMFSVFWEVIPPGPRLSLQIKSALQGSLIPGILAYRAKGRRKSNEILQKGLFISWCSSPKFWAPGSLRETGVSEDGIDWLLTRGPCPRVSVLPGYFVLWVWGSPISWLPVQNLSLM